MPKARVQRKRYPVVGPARSDETNKEDEGYLMDIVYYPLSNTSEFVIWDAAAGMDVRGSEPWW